MDRTWIIEHTGWRLQDEARASQPGDPPQGGVGGYSKMRITCICHFGSSLSAVALGCSTLDGFWVNFVNIDTQLAQL